MGMKILVEYLSEHGANTNKKKWGKGKHHFFNACISGNNKYYKIFIRNWSRYKNEENKYGDTPLSTAACKMRNLKILNYLIEHGGKYK